MKVDSSPSYFLRQPVPGGAPGEGSSGRRAGAEASDSLRIPRRPRLAVALLCLALGGCSATGEASGDHTIRDAALPFTFRVPADFTKEPVDQFDSSGDVIVGVGIDKLDVVAVRSVGPGTALPRGDVPHTVQGRSVTSQLHRVPGGFAFECQWRPGKRGKVLGACREAVASVARR